MTIQSLPTMLCILLVAMTTAAQRSKESHLRMREDIVCVCRRRSESLADVAIVKHTTDGHILVINKASDQQSLSCPRER